MQDENLFIKRRFNLIKVFCLDCVVGVGDVVFLVFCQRYLSFFDVLFVDVEVGYEATLSEGALGLR